MRKFLSLGKRTFYFVLAGNGGKRTGSRRAVVKSTIQEFGRAVGGARKNRMVTRQKVSFCGPNKAGEVWAARGESAFLSAVCVVSTSGGERVFHRGYLTSH